VLTPGELENLKALVNALRQQLEAIEARYKAEAASATRGAPPARHGTRIL